MSTRCTVHFYYGDEGNPSAIIYRHSDGYPDTEHGVIASLDRFFKDVEAQTGGDTRFGDPTYLAAKFLVWQANEYRNGALLDFLSVAPMLRDPDDIEYRYNVRCSPQWNAGRPSVTWDEA